MNRHYLTWKEVHETHHSALQQTVDSSEDLSISTDKGQFENDAQQCRLERNRLSILNNQNSVKHFSHQALSSRQSKYTTDFDLAIMKTNKRIPSPLSVSNAFSSSSLSSQYQTPRISPNNRI